MLSLLSTSISFFSHLFYKVKYIKNKIEKVSLKQTLLCSVRVLELF